jgi:hypothetical protein
LDRKIYFARVAIEEENEPQMNRMDADQRDEETEFDPKGAPDTLPKASPSGDLDKIPCDKYGYPYEDNHRDC